MTADRTVARAERQCPVCLTWFMSRRQRDHHMTLRHPMVRWAVTA